MQVIYLNSQDNILIGKINAGEDDILVSCDAVYGAFNINLPRVDEANGTKMLFKKVDSTTNAVTLTAKGEYIENAETYTLNEVNSMVQIFGTKDKYWILNNTAAQVGATSTVALSVAGNFVIFADNVGGLKDSGISATGGVF